MRLKEILFVLFVSIFCCVPKVNAQVLEAKDLVLELNIGYPNIKPVLGNLGGISHGGFGSVLNEKSRGIGQFTVKSEFLMSDRIGFIASLNYRYFYEFAQREYDIYDGDTDTWSVGRYDYESKWHYFRWLFGFNFHLLRTDRLDTYLGILGGGNFSLSSFYSNDPNASQQEGFKLPLNARVHYGLRYFIDDNWAVNVEFGLGGPLVNGGVTYKF
ncbi:hypothetical protein [Crocinitomix algicola]|uniref:hypothetical protein n=1 Tax=Crocinitomix algicola TaxID=1740263 RepID=UPI00082BE1D7|nr:hypothetical protein [Crocinitomix algicola]